MQFNLCSFTAIIYFQFILIRIKFCIQKCTEEAPLGTDNKIQVLDTVHAEWQLVHSIHTHRTCLYLRTTWLATARCRDRGINDTWRDNRMKLLAVKKA